MKTTFSIECSECGSQLPIRDVETDLLGLISGIQINVDPCITCMTKQRRDLLNQLNLELSEEYNSKLIKPVYRKTK